jgi:hypothetical protein
MLLAASAGYIHQAQPMENTHTQFHDLAVLYNALKAEYERQIEQQEALLKDEYGIVHCNLPAELRDPVYAVLSDKSRVQLQSDPAALTNFNNTLKLRQLYKKALHKAWNISEKAATVVHQALYALIDCSTIPERINKIHELVGNPQLNDSDQKALMQALFLPNGVIKDFADYERVQSLKISAVVLQPAHAKTRTLLNHVIYAERIDDQYIKNKCAEAIEYIKSALATDNQDSSIVCLEQVHILYDDIHNQNPIFDKEKLKSCGSSSQQKPPLATGNCLPEIVTIPEKTSCTPGDQNRIEKDRLCGSDLVTAPDPEPIPCGAHGQTLPGFGVDEMPVDEEEDERDHDQGEDTEKDSSSEKDVKIPTQQEIDESKAIEERLLEGTIKKRKKTKGKSVQFETNMYETLQEAIDAAKQKFKSANPTKVVSIDEGECGDLPDGRSINWRWKSSEGSPTVEIHNRKNDKRIKIRFVNKESKK